MFYAKPFEKMNTLHEIFNLCKSPDLGVAMEALNDLGFCIEQCRMNKQSECFDFFYNKAYYDLRLTEEQIDDCVYFLFYLLMNHRDRAARVAWCLDKCYDPNIINGLAHAIELYMGYEDDDTVFGIVMAITSIHDLDKVDEKIIEVLKRAQAKNLPDTKEFLTRTFELHGVN